MFMLIVQEDAEPRAKPPIRNESLRQPSVRVHLQHFPRWALQHIHTDNSHTRMENTLYRRLSVGHPKLCRDPEMCASLLMNQSDLVWRRERESFPCSDCRQFKREEEAGGGMAQERCENVPLGSLRRCIIHRTAAFVFKEPGCVLWLRASQQTALQLRQHKITQSASQTCVHMFCVWWQTHLWRRPMSFKRQRQQLRI